LSNSNRKRLRPGIVSPRRKVPKDITKPPYVKSMVPPGIASGPEVHDKKGIECMRASGRLAAQVLQYAGTLVKVRSFHLWSVNPTLSNCLFPIYNLIAYYM
jgi:methionyl aminopeptidase